MRVLKPGGRLQFADIATGKAVPAPVDTFGGAGGESKARLFEVFGYGCLPPADGEKIGVAATISREGAWDIARRQGIDNRAAAAMESH